MKIYCEHVGHGEESSGPVSELETQVVVHYNEYTEGTLTVTLDPIDTDAPNPRLDAGARETHHRLTVRCKCGWAFSARWTEWLQYLVKIGDVDRLEIGVVKRTYELARRAQSPDLNR